MTEYWVSHKRMNQDETRIESVKALIKKPEGGLLQGKEFLRDQVVNSIEDTKVKNKWITCKFNRKEGDTIFWDPGEKIHVIVIHGTKFIRTDKNHTESDNLGELPDY